MHGYIKSQSKPVTTYPGAGPRNGVNPFDSQIIRSSRRQYLGQEMETEKPRSVHKRDLGGWGGGTMHNALLQIPPAA